MADDKEPKRPRPEMLGSGGAAKVATEIEKRKERECKEIYGGMYDFASGQCKNKQY